MKIFVLLALLAACESPSVVSVTTTTAASGSAAPDAAGPWRPHRIANPTAALLCEEARAAGVASDCNYDDAGARAVSMFHIVGRARSARGFFVTFQSREALRRWLSRGEEADASAYVRVYHVAPNANACVSFDGDVPADARAVIVQILDAL